MAIRPVDTCLPLMVSGVPARIGSDLLLASVAAWSTISHRPGLVNVNVAVVPLMTGVKALFA